MQMAIDSAGIHSSEVDYINAHGTSTRINDQFESEAILDLFGDHATQLAISSTKSVTGHCMGAAGAIEAVYLAMAIFKGIVPPTMNLANPDPLCPFDYTANVAQDRQLRVGLSNSFGFGGTNATIAFKHFH